MYRLHHCAGMPAMLPAGGTSPVPYHVTPCKVMQGMWQDLLVYRSQGHSAGTGPSVAQAVDDGQICYPHVEPWQRGLELYNSANSSDVAP